MFLRIGQLIDRCLSLFYDQVALQQFHEFFIGFRLFGIQISAEIQEVEHRSAFPIGILTVDLRRIQISNFVDELRFGFERRKSEARCLLVRLRALYWVIQHLHVTLLSFPQINFDARARFLNHGLFRYYPQILVNRTGHSLSLVGFIHVSRRQDGIDIGLSIVLVSFEFGEIQQVFAVLVRELPLSVNALLAHVLPNGLAPEYQRVCMLAALPALRLRQFVAHVPVEVARRVIWLLGCAGIEYFLFGDNVPLAHAGHVELVAKNALTEQSTLTARILGRHLQIPQPLHFLQARQEQRLSLIARFEQLTGLGEST